MTKIIIETYQDDIIATTFDANGTAVSLALEGTTVDAATRLIAAAVAVEPQWQKEKAIAEAAVVAAMADKVKAENEQAVAMAAVLELSEMLYGDGTETPLPELPEATP